VAQHGGQVVRPRGEGDSRFCVFARAIDAVVAAATVQQVLRAEPWPMAAPLKVRMALRTGEADLREEDYYGSAVNPLRAAASDRPWWPDTPVPRPLPAAGPLRTLVGREAEQAAIDQELDMAKAGALRVLVIEG